MRILAGLLVAQFLCILLLIFKVFELDRRLDALSAPAPTAAVGDSVNTTPAPDMASQTAIDEARLRAIVSSEIRSAMAQLALAQPETSESPPEEEVSPAEMQARLNHATSQFEYYLARGEINPTEMARLQADIMLLDPESREQMIRLLVRAIRSGDLEGEL